MFFSKDTLTLLDTHANLKQIALIAFNRVVSKVYDFTFVTHLVASLGGLLL